MNDKPRVSIIMRTRNRPLVLGRAIDSVLAQTFTDWQLVLVDDAGDQAAIEVVLAPRRAALGGRLLELHRAQSCGMEAASNAGIREAAGEFITLLDDDDTWHPTFLEKSIGFLEKAPEVWGGVSCLVELVFERLQGSELTTLARRPQFPELRHCDLLTVLHKNVVSVHSFVYRKRIWEELGGYREDFAVVGDRDFQIRFLLKHDIFLLPELLAYYHIRVADEAGAYLNSGQTESHSSHHALIKNEAIRADLESRRLGLGTFFLMEEYVERHLIEQERLLFEIKEHLRHQDPVYWMRRLGQGLKRGAKGVGRLFRK